MNVINTLKETNKVVIVSLLFMVVGLIGLNNYQSEKSSEEISNLTEQVESLKEGILTEREEANRVKTLLAKTEEENDALIKTLEELKEKQSKLEEENKKFKPVSRGGNPGKLLGTFEATAYDDSPQSQGKWVGQTASGMKPQVGVIAVDPKVIPLGTKLYVEGYGNCIAGDTGGAIKGRKIDLFMNTRQECREWGRRRVKVYLR